MIWNSAGSSNIDIRTSLSWKLQLAGDDSCTAVQFAECYWFSRAR